MQRRVGDERPRDVDPDRDQQRRGHPAETTATITARRWWRPGALRAPPGRTRSSFREWCGRWSAAKAAFVSTLAAQEILKGLAEPVDVYEVAWKDADRDAPEPGTTPSSFRANLNEPAGGLLVGRDDVLARQTTAWEAVRGAAGVWSSSPGNRVLAKPHQPRCGVGWPSSRGRRSSPAAAPRKAVIAYQPFVEILHQLLSDRAARRRDQPARSAGRGIGQAGPRPCGISPEPTRGQGRARDRALLALRSSRSGPATRRSTGPAGGRPR